nr:FecR domain-containing protein [uncultured Pseudodesulfovibrio sp.]
MCTAKRITRTALFTALFICIAQIPAFATDTQIGEVIAMAGTVIAEQPNGTSRQLELNQPIITQDTIATGTKSSIEILFKDESVYSQGPDSRISLDNFVYSTNVSASKLLFKMGEGTFRYVTGQIVKTNPDAFALQTPTTTIGIRGTEVFAIVTPDKEEIGNTKLSKKHTMTVGDKALNIPRTSVNVNPQTGAVSDPTPVSQETINKIVKAAPMTSLGELGNPGPKKDLERKVQSFKQQIERNKESLDGLSNKPDYEKLHRIKVQKTNQETTEKDRDSGGNSGDLGGGEGGGDGGGGGGH